MHSCHDWNIVSSILWQSLFYNFRNVIYCFFHIIMIMFQNLVFVFFAFYFFAWCSHKLSNMHLSLYEK